MMRTCLPVTRSLHRVCQLCHQCCVLCSSTQQSMCISKFVPIRPGNTWYKQLIADLHGNPTFCSLALIRLVLSMPFATSITTGKHGVGEFTTQAATTTPSLSRAPMSLRYSGDYSCVVVIVVVLCAGCVHCCMMLLKFCTKATGRKGAAYLA